VIALQAALALAFAAFLLARADVQIPFVDGGHWSIQAAFADASGLRGQTRAPVLVAGVPSGNVTDVRYVNGVAVATLQLADAARGVIRSDATAAIEPRSALQDMSVDITPGSRSTPALTTGARIAATRTRTAVTLDRVVADLDAGTRAQLQVMLGELAVGLRSRPGALRSALQRLDAAVDPSARVLQGLAQRRQLITRLSGELATVTTALGRHDSALRGALSAGRETLGATAQQSAALTQTVRALPSALTATNQALAQIHRLAAPLDRALEGLQPAARSMPAAMQSVRAAAPALRALLSAGGQLESKGAKPLADARTVARLLGPTAERARSPIGRLEPLVAAVNRNRNGIGLLGERFSGVLSTNDANGTVLRGLGFFEPFNPADVGFPGASGAQLARLKAESVTALTNACLRSNQVACLARYLIPGLPGAVKSR
jgi:virulence factor Mce-like protein